MSIRWKLGILFLIISLAPLITFNVIGLNRSQHLLRQEIGMNFKLIARDRAMAVAAVLNRRVDEAISLAKNPRIIAAAVDKNSSYSEKGNDFAVQEIKRIDHAWLQSKGDTPTARNILGYDISDFLRGYRNRDPLEYGEIFITDRLGATVAMTSMLTDYYQADEGWWSEGFAGGKGAIYIDDRGYDLSVNAVVTGIVVPVRAGGEVVGLLKINFKMAHIPAVIINPYEGGEVAVFMHRSNGTAVIDPSGGQHKNATQTEARIMAEGLETGWTEDYHGTEPTIMGYARVQPEKMIYSRFQATASRKGVSGENWGKTEWYVFVERSRAIAYAPLTELMIIFIVGGAILAIAIVLVAGVISTRVTKPLLQMRKGMEAVASGNLDLRIGGDRRDEIGDTLRDIDRMVVQLKKTTASRMELQQEVEQRKQAELSLEEKSTALETANVVLTNAQRIAHLGNWDWNVKTGDIFWSDEIYRIFGHEPQSFDANYNAFIETVHPDDRQVVLTAVDKALRNKTPYNIYHRITLPDGSIKHVHEQGEVVLDEAGEPTYMLGTVYDITERIQLEDQLRATQRMQAVGQLTGGIAHDFNNLLGVVIGNAEILEDVIKEDKNARRNVDAIIKAANRGASLTGRLLAFSRKQNLSPRPTKINELVSGLEDMLQRTLGETIELRTHLGQGACEALIDPHQFEDALVNMAINARDAMASGGSLTIETTNITLDEAHVAEHKGMMPGDYVMVAVIDTGSGMASDVLNRVFEPFFTTKDVGKGSGLGLSMVYGFVKQSNGYITIDSEVGRGTTVKLYMPISGEVLAEVDTEEKSQKFELGSERILVVEDNEELREISTVILQNQGYEIVEAQDGREAIKRLQEGPPIDLLFADVVLPGGMNGMEVAEEAKRIQPDIKVLFTSGYAEETMSHDGKLDPGITLVSKPFRKAEMLEKVRAALDAADD